MGILLKNQDFFTRWLLSLLSQICSNGTSNSSKMTSMRANFTLSSTRRISETKPKLKPTSKLMSHLALLTNLPPTIKLKVKSQNSVEFLGKPRLPIQERLYINKISTTSINKSKDWRE